MTFWPKTCRHMLQPLKHMCWINPDTLPETTDPDFEFEYIDIGNVTLESGVIGREHMTFGNAPSRARKPVRPNDVIVSTVRTYLKAVATIPADADRWVVSTGFAVLRNKPCTNPRYLYRVVQSNAFVESVVAVSTGVSYPAINPSTLGRIPVPIPDTESQRSIADFLDQETARINQLIEKKQQFLETADERWRATLNHMVFPNSPDWQRLPSDWRKVRLKYLTDPKRPIMYGIVLPGPNMDEGPMIVKGGDVKPGRLHPKQLCRTTIEIEAQYPRSRLKAGDLVISIRGGIGDVEIVPPEIEGANLTQDAARIAPRLGVDREWLRFALLSSSVFHPLEARSLGAAVRGINIFDLKRVFVPEPPNTTQVLVARKLKHKEGRLSELREKVLLHAERLREFRSALITAAVTGQIDLEAWGRRGETDRRLDKIEEEMAQPCAAGQAEARA